MVRYPTVRQLLPYDGDNEGRATSKRHEGGLYAASLDMELAHSFKPKCQRDMQRRRKTKSRVVILSHSGRPPSNRPFLISVVGFRVKIQPQTTSATHSRQESDARHHDRIACICSSRLICSIKPMTGFYRNG